MYPCAATYTMPLLFKNGKSPGKACRSQMSEFRYQLQTPPSVLQHLISDL